MVVGAERQDAERDFRSGQDLGDGIHRAVAAAGDDGREMSGRELGLRRALELAAVEEDRLDGDAMPGEGADDLPEHRATSQPRRRAAAGH